MIQGFLLVLAGLLGFAIVLIATPYGKKYLYESGIYGVDQQKKNKPRLPSSGGLIVLLGFITALSFYLGADNLFNNYSLDPTLILAAMSSILIISLVGLIDDIRVSSGTADVDRKGLNQYVKAFLVLPAAFPLISVSAGSTTMIFPLIGRIDWGYIYPIFLLPIGLMFVANVVNMLEGVNGLGALLSLITSTTLGTFAFVSGQWDAAAISFLLSFCLAAFLIFNFYPASILPGDSFTYLCGAVMFSAIVLGNMEKFGIFVFSIWLVEFFLKARRKFDVHSWGVLQDDGSLESQYDKYYSLTHIFMDYGLKEKEIVVVLGLTQFLICSVGLVLFLVF